MTDRTNARLPEGVPGKSYKALGLALLLAVSALVGSASTTQADVIPFNPTGGGAVGAIPITGFDELPGNALAKNVIQNGTITVGETFNLYYQASVGKLLNGNTSVNLPANTQITVLAGFTERVTGLTTGIDGSVTATFALAPIGTPNAINFVKFYESPTPPSADNATGANFAQGNLFLQATVDPTKPNGGNFTRFFNSIGPIAPGSAQQSVSGSGSTSLIANIVPGSALPGYFPSNSTLQIISLDFQTTTSLPFSNGTSPSSGFNSTGMLNTPDITPNLGAVNGVNGPDFQFQADASNGFTTPEPSSVVLTAMGLVGMLGLGWRKRNASV
jgi:hypothetical protein